MPRKSGIIITPTLNSCKHEVFIDSGSSINIVSRGVANEIVEQSKSVIYTNFKTFHLADGQSTSTDECLMAQIQYNDTSQIAEFIIMDSYTLPTSVLIGYPTMVHLGFSINHQDTKILELVEELPLSSHYVLTEKDHIIAHTMNDFTLPGFSSYACALSVLDLQGQFIVEKIHSSLKTQGIQTE